MLNFVHVEHSIFVLEFQTEVCFSNITFDWTNY